MATAIGDWRLGWLTEHGTRTERPAAAASAVEALVAAYSATLYRIALSILRNAAEAEDVVQETFVRLLEQRTSLDSLREPRQWLARIAWNLALDRKQRIQPQQMDDVVAEALAAEECRADQALAEARRLSDVLAVMERLPRRERDVLLLSAVEELSTREIAAVLDISESSVRSLQFRARRHIEERLAHAEMKAQQGRGGKR